jgi:uncharacterized protein YfaS (alpha-2-macroglobulin family)
MPNGAMSYWPGEQYADDWGTSYAGHFMLEAERKGFTLPLNTLRSWKEVQRQKAVSWSYNTSYYNNELMQAYRLYTLALAKAPELGAMNKLLEKKDLSLTARWQLAAAYVLAGKREVALQLVNSAPVNVKPYRELYFTYGSDLRDKAIIVDALCLMDLKTKAAPLALEISSSLCKDEWYSTQSTAFALLAMAKFTGATAGKAIRASVEMNSDAGVVLESQKSFLTHAVDVRPGKKGIIKMTNQGKGVLFARLIISGIPAYGDNTTASNNLKISMVFKEMSGKVISPLQISQGTSFMSEVTVTNPGLRGEYHQLALSQVFPSGWEVINARSSDLAQSQMTWSQFTCQDVRDDRVNTFFDLEPGKSKTFRVMLMSAYLGKFYLPSTGCEAMYDNTISARVPGSWVEVVPAAK